MLSSNVVSALFASIALAAALPEYAPLATTPIYGLPPSKSTCSVVYSTEIKTGESTSTASHTDTVTVSVSTMIPLLTTNVVEVPVSSVGVVTETFTYYETSMKTETYPVTTVTTSTIYEATVISTESTSLYPTTSVGTSYITEVETGYSTLVTGTTSETVCYETKMIPWTSFYTETTTECMTKGGYGGR
ncbi:hypothetical protein CC78DRAFT_573375 [Lojkania enalia]|uniref:Uncharacterized protein n=1 Tax=Lojkania enalia TaxID=147567 RepID=A0A9P4NDA1_9PLEO|nr:hypothetical protein CC78DRAFT_573375 [Didymosphaeria enalia]